MNDRAVSLLEQYDIGVVRARKGRSAIICDTNDKCLILKEYTGSEEKLAKQNEVLNALYDKGFVDIEKIVASKEGALFVKDGDGTKYILKTYISGRECNNADKDECVQIIEKLGELHSNMEKIDIEDNSPTLLQEREYEKHNRELKRVRRFIKQKSQRNTFEISLLNNYDYFMNKAFEVTEKMRTFREENPDIAKTSLYCHGDYQYHNVLYSSEKWFIINFEKMIKDDPVRDIHLLLRKLMEKNNWDPEFGKRLMDAYENKRPLSKESRIDLYYRLMYPEKFWKIVNFYYNSGKAWIPDKNLGKLEKLIELERDKRIFMTKVFE